MELSKLCTPHPVQGLHQLAALTNLRTLNLGGTNTEFNEPDWLHALTSLTLLTCTQSLASASQLQSYMSRSSGSCCTVVSQPADTTNVEAQHVYVHNSEEVQYSSYFYEDEGYSKGACTDSWQGQHTVDAMQKDKQLFFTTVGWTYATLGTLTMIVTYLTMRTLTTGLTLRLTFQQWMSNDRIWLLEYMMLKQVSAQNNGC